MPIVLPAPLVGYLSGDPNLYLEGDPSAVPLGIECFLEYKGQIINYKDTADRIHVKSLTGLGDPDVRHVAETLPEDDGEDPGISRYGGRTMVMSGEVEAGNMLKLRTMQMGLRQLFVDLQEYPLVFRTGDPTRDAYIVCRKHQSNAMDDQQQNFAVEREFQIFLRASKPEYLSYIEVQSRQNFGFLETFSSDVLDPVNPSYTYGLGSGMVISNGVLKAASTGAKRLVRVSGVKWADNRQTIKITPKTALTLASSHIGISLKRLDATNILYARLLTTTNPPTMELRKIDAGVDSVIAGSALVGAVPSLVLNTSVWIRPQIVGNAMQIEFWATDPTLGGAPAATRSVALGGADIAKFGDGVKADVGLQAQPASLDWELDDHRVEPLSIENVVALSVLNKGNYLANPIIRLYGPMDAVSNEGEAARLTNAMTGQAIVIMAKEGSTEGIPAGSYYEMDVRKRRLREFDAATQEEIANRFDQLTIASERIKFVPGVNQLELNVASASGIPAAETLHRHTWM